MSVVPPVVADVFAPYGVTHWLILAAIAASTTLLTLLLRRTAGGPHEQTVRRAVCWSLAAILLAGAVVAQIHRVTAGIWSVQESLPLHLCDIGVLVTAATLIGVGRNSPPKRIWQRLYELAFIWGMGGTTQSILTPDLADAFPNPECVRYFVLHGGIVVSVLMLTLGLRMRLQPGTPVRVWLATLVLAVIVVPLDWLLGANYMYLLGPPKHPTIIDLLGPWPRSLLPLVLLATLLILACYAPFWALRRRALQKAR